MRPAALLLVMIVRTALAAPQLASLVGGARLARPAGLAMVSGGPSSLGRVACAAIRGGAVPVARGAAAGVGGLLPFKLGLAGCLCAFNVLCWGAPLRYKQFTGSASRLSLASTFSGGVFLALAFGHMIPEAAAAFATSVGADAGAKAACTWTLAGYLLIWGVDRFSAGGEAAAGGDDDNKAASTTMLLGALSVHSMLETAALAVARTKATAGLLAASIALHQPAESLALLVALLRAGFSGKKLLKLLLVFSAMGPIGALAGLGLQAKFAALGGALDGALIALTAGTFVYVGATEVIPDEFAGGSASKRKVAALLLGVVTILGLANLAELVEHAAAAAG